ncbi:MAG: TetR/AcrR family transcriptional regulator [Bacteroidota bacterium]
MDDAGRIKERIIATARDRFLREGFARVLVDDIVEDLGISKKTFYKHFESKEELLRLIISQAIAETYAHLRSILDGGDGFVIKLDRLMTFLGNQYARFGRTIMADCHRYLPELWHEVQEFRRERIAREVKRLILEGMRGGFIRKDLNVELFLAAFTAGVDGVMAPAFLTTQPISGREALNGIMGIFFQGILTAPARTQLVRRRAKREHNPLHPSRITNSEF